MYEIRFYITGDGKKPFIDWYERIRDHRAKLAIERRIQRVEYGNFGDHKSCGEGVLELRIDTGPGYRVYCATAGTKILLLLCGGDKRTQAADIDRAHHYWKLWQGENNAQRTL